MKNFFNRIHVPQTNIQIGEANNVMAVLEKNFDLDTFLSVNKSKNLYFLAGVKKERQLQRARNEDVILKKYFVVDLDLRNEFGEISDTEIKTLGRKICEYIDDTERFCDWSYLVFSGNGLHIYYIGDAVEYDENVVLGVHNFYQEFQKEIGHKVDMNCSNAARILRIPGSYNNKKEPKLVEFLEVRDRVFDLSSLAEDGKRTKAKMLADQAAQKKNFTEDDGEVFEKINKIPISEIVCNEYGWIFDGRHFKSPGEQKEKGCFVPSGINAVCWGGTDHFNQHPTAKAMSPFLFVKHIHDLDEYRTFLWFSEKYPHIAEIRKKAQIEWVRTNEIAPAKEDDGSIDLVCQEFKKFKLVYMKTIPFLDDLDLFIRGTVCRIGAYSNTGKSKFGYFITEKLLENGYKGAVFSTEVCRQILLANFIGVVERKYFKAIMASKEYRPETIEKLKHLKLFAQESGVAFLENIEKKIKAAPELDFVLIDFVQAVSPTERGANLFEKMSAYALEIQAIAQKYNILVIDLSQVSNDGIRNDDFGILPFKGGGDLVASADVGILLKRQKDESNAPMDVLVRKHKYAATGNYTAECDLAICDFFNFHQFEQKDNKI